MSKYVKDTYGKNLKVWVEGKHLTQVTTKDGDWCLYNPANKEVVAYSIDDFNVDDVHDLMEEAYELRAELQRTHDAMRQVADMLDDQTPARDHMRTVLLGVLGSDATTAPMPAPDNVAHAKLYAEYMIARISMLLHTDHPVAKSYHAGDIVCTMEIVLDALNNKGLPEAAQWFEDKLAKLQADTDTMTCELCASIDDVHQRTDERGNYVMDVCEDCMPVECEAVSDDAQMCPTCAIAMDEKQDLYKWIYTCPNCDFTEEFP